MYTEHLPIFPLNVVVFPAETLHLHIFEPRYKQLINECITQGKTFGMPVFLHQRIQTFGTELIITEVTKIHAEGRLDIKTKGLRRFRLSNVRNPANSEKLYADAAVEWINDTEDPPHTILPGLLERLHSLYHLLNIPIEFDTRIPLFAFHIAHKVGLSIEQNYELLSLSSELKRQAFIVQHLEKALPIVVAMEQTKERIKMNGHFRNFDPLSF